MWIRHQHSMDLLRSETKRDFTKLPFKRVRAYAKVEIGTYPHVDIHCFKSESIVLKGSGEMDRYG